MKNLNSVLESHATGRSNCPMDEANTVRLTVCGSFGFGNAGDEAVPIALADIGAYLGFSMNVNVVGRFDEPALSQVIGLGPRDASRRETLRGYPLLLSGGGIIE